MGGLSLQERLDPRRFFRGERAVEGPVRLDHRRVFILPTRRGLALGLLLFIQILTATQYNNNLAFILSFLLASIALLSILYGYRNLAGLVLRSGRTEPVFVGEKVLFEIHLENPSPTPRLSVNILLKTAAPLTLSLPPADSLPIKLPIPTERRGWLYLPTVTLASIFPLGMFRTWSPINLKQRVLIYPRPAADPLPFPEYPGASGQRQASDDFHGFQSYQPGDSLRHIHWKGVAKGQGVHIKEYRGEEHSDVRLDWVRTPGADTEAKLSRLCRWVLDAEKAGLRYALSLPGTELTSASSPDHLRRCLEALALHGIHA